MVGRQRPKDHAKALRRPCNGAGPPPRQDSIRPARVLYVVRVRGTHASRRDWASFITAVREATLLSKAEFARRIDVDRGTVNRWEAGTTTPTDVQILTRLSKVFRLDYEEVLAAAGFRPVQDVEHPEPERDEEVELILNSGLSQAAKVELLDDLERERAQDRDRRMDRTRRMIDIYRRRVG